MLTWMTCLGRFDLNRLWASRPTRESERFAFTLVEVLIAILLISILFSLGVLFTSSNSTTRKMRNFEYAIALAQQAVEVLRASPFDTLDSLDAQKKSLEEDFNQDDPEPDLYRRTTRIGEIVYERTVTVEEVRNADEKKGINPRLKYVLVTVAWTPPDGERLTYKLTTTIADLN
ncbi:MAG TPA: prepilin-type N-terminal cleavage/methylation domain-containing protein [Candidatus Ozemobacteraceae bacterium]|nr:prepilin-type N-terminal cleavage/methylation domain-containing protein [Candidatus Ozemobacteraceae bacterium]